MPTYIDSVPNPEAVALSVIGNHLDETLVMEFRRKGWPTAMPI
jgi:hypothetical protein